MSGWWFVAIVLGCEAFCGACVIVGMWLGGR